MQLRKSNLSVPSQHIENQYEEHEEQTPIKVEENVPERGLEEKIIAVPENEVQVVPPLAPVQHQPPAFIKTL